MTTYEEALLALADPTRRAIVDELRKGALPVGRLAERLPVSRPAVSQHLRVLKDAGLVGEARQGTRRIYHVERRGLVALRRYLDQLWGDALRAFGDEANRAGRDREGQRPRGTRERKKR